MSSNEVTWKDKLKAYTRTPGSLIVMLLVMLSAIMTFAVLIFLIVYVLAHGVPYLKPSIFSLHYTSENASLMPALINTVIMTLVITSDRSSIWNLRSDLPCGICKTWE